MHSDYIYPPSLIIQDKHIERNDDNMQAMEQSFRASLDSIKEIIESHRNE